MEPSFYTGVYNIPSYCIEAHETWQPKEKEILCPPGVPFFTIFLTVWPLVTSHVYWSPQKKNRIPGFHRLTESLIAIWGIHMPSMVSI